MYGPFRKPKHASCASLLLRFRLEINMTRPHCIVLTAFFSLLRGQASAQRLYDAPTTMANLVSDAGFKH